MPFPNLVATNQKRFTIYIVNKVVHGTVSGALTVDSVEASIEASRVDVIDDVGGGSMPQSALVLNGGCNSLVLFLHFALLEDVTAVDVRVLNARNLSREILTQTSSDFSVSINH